MEIIINGNSVKEMTLAEIARLATIRKREEWAEVTRIRNQKIQDAVNASLPYMMQQAIETIERAIERGCFSCTLVFGKGSRFAECTYPEECEEICRHVWADCDWDIYKDNPKEFLQKVRQALVEEGFTVPKMKTIVTHYESHSGCSKEDVEQFAIRVSW